MPDQISRDLFIFNKVHLPPCLSEAVCFKCSMSRSRNYLCLHSLKEEDITRRFHSFHPKISKQLRASLLQPNGSILVGPKASICKPKGPQLAGAQAGAGSWNSAKLTLTQHEQGGDRGRNNIKPPKHQLPIKVKHPPCTLVSFAVRSTDRGVYFRGLCHLMVPF